MLPTVALKLGFVLLFFRYTFLSEALVCWLAMLDKEKAKIQHRLIKIIRYEFFNVHLPCETYNAQIRG
jgi:hypothetical protein